LSASLSVEKALSATIAGQSALIGIELNLKPSIASPDTRVDVLVHRTIAEVQIDGTSADLLVHRTLARVVTKNE